MKSVLILSYYFPPMGMGGVQRITKFARYLPEFGWEPTVLTVKPVAYYAHDASLLDEVRHVRIERTGSLDPLRVIQLFKKSKEDVASPVSSGGGRLSRIHQWMTRWFLVPDSKVLWRPFAKNAIRRLLRERSFDLVLTSSPPHSAHALGAWMQKKHPIPWVADFRDVWMGEAYERGPTFLHDWIHSRMRSRILRKADAVVSVSTPGSRILAEVRGSEVMTLHNGFDIRDFQNPVDSSGKKERMTVTFTGAINSLLDPDPYFRAVRLLLDQHPEMRSRMQIRFIGSSYGLDLESLIRSHGLQDVVEITGYVSHAGSVKALLESDLLLLLVSPAISGAHISGKVFEYLASGKPILGVMPEGEAAQMIRDFHAGTVVPPDNANAIADALLQYHKSWEQDDLRSNPVCMEPLRQFERKVQTERLAHLFDSMIKNPVEHHE